jgi:hypothetical protein
MAATSASSTARREKGRRYRGVEWFKATWLVNPDSPKQIERHIPQETRFREFLGRELQYSDDEADELIESLRAAQRK